MHQLDRLDTLRDRAGAARVSPRSRLVAFIADEDARAEITATAQKRFGTLRVRPRDRHRQRDRRLYAALADRGVERFYVWFTDFAPPETLAAFGAEVIAELASP